MRIHDFLNMEEVFGKKALRDKNATCNIAIAVCNGAGSGYVTPDDAEQICRQRRIYSRKPMQPGKPLTDSDRSQISKCRRFIEVGKKFRERAVIMLKMVMDIYVENDFHNSTYEKMLTVCRRTLKVNRILGRDEIIKLLN